MQFQTICPNCKEDPRNPTRTTTTKLDGENLDRALTSDEDVEIVCFSCGQDRKATAQEKANLHKFRVPVPR